MAIIHEIEPSEQHETIRQTVEKVEERQAVFVGVPVPTMAAFFAAFFAYSCIWRCSTETC